MRLNKWMAVLALALVAGGVEGAADPAVLRSSMQAQIQEAKARLNLTAEQEAQLQPVVQERAAAFKAIRDKHAGDTSRRGRTAMFKEARPVQQDYEKKVRGILTEPQIKEWEKMRDEAKARLREQLRKGGVPE